MSTPRRGRRWSRCCGRSTSPRSAAGAAASPGGLQVQGRRQVADAGVRGRPTVRRAERPVRRLIPFSVLSGGGHCCMVHSLPGTALTNGLATSVRGNWRFAANDVTCIYCGAALALVLASIVARGHIDPTSASRAPSPSCSYTVS